MYWGDVPRIGERGGPPSAHHRRFYRLCIAPRSNRRARALHCQPQPGVYMVEGFSVEEVLGDDGALALESLLAELRALDETACAADPRCVAERARRLATLSSILLDGYRDLSLIHQTVVEHSTEIENELSARNDRITELTENMRRYLSPQLYQRIAGGEVRAESRENRRRRITVFFSDLVGFTDLTDSLEPELLSDILNRYLEAMVDIATRWGATIDKFIGDAVMVFFGDDDETTPEEGAWRCARMALEMQSDMGRLLDSLALGADRRLQTRMGINTGVCTVGNFGSVKHRMAYTAIGRAVNIASRLEGAAPPGGILLSGSTFNLVAGRVRAESRGQLKLKGVAHPVEAWELLGLASDQPAGRTALTESDGGFHLSALDLVPGVTSRVEREEMRRALQRALALLDGKV